MVYELLQDSLEMPLSRITYDLASANFQVWLDEKLRKIIEPPRNDSGLDLEL